MVGFLLLVLIIGALVAAIWGRQTAQNLMGTLAFGAVLIVALIIDVVACIIWPQFRMVATALVGIFLFSLAYIGYTLVKDESAMARQKQEQEKKYAYQRSQREHTTQSLLQQTKQALDRADESQCNLLGQQLQAEKLLLKAIPLFEIAANDADEVRRFCAILMLRYPEMTQFLGQNHEVHCPVYSQQASNILLRVAADTSEPQRNRIAAIIALGWVTRTESVGLILQMLKDRDGELRAAACIALGHYGADMEVKEQCVNAVCQALGDPYEAVRLQAAEALGELADARTLKSVQQMAVNVTETMAVRQAAANAVNKIKNAAMARI